MSKADEITFGEVLAVCGSADHDEGDVTLADVNEAMGELHPAVAGKLVEHIQRGIDSDESLTNSGSEHPDWHDSLRRALENSNDKM